MADDYASSKELNLVREAVRDVITTHTDYLKAQIRDNHAVVLRHIADMQVGITDIKSNGCQRGASNHADITAIQKDMKRASGIAGGIVAAILVVLEKLASYFIFRSHGGGG
jgi:hypothetical protein